ncbi:MAG: hypothetical protein NUV51_00920, partial [Sulfuricaulis sp.]|nr:hypothetical protein [Sulfuricaulis sp.]
IQFNTCLDGHQYRLGTASVAGGKPIPANPVDTPPIRGRIPEAPALGEYIWRLPRWYLKLN